MTGEWSYGHGGGLVPPVRLSNPSPMGYPGGVVFTPPPIFAFPSPPESKKGEGKKKAQQEEKEKNEENKREAYWEEMYDKDGIKFWKHTITNKTTYRDPYF